MPNFTPIMACLGFGSFLIITEPFLKKVVVILSKSLGLIRGVPFEVKSRLICIPVILLLWVFLFKRTDS